MRKIPKKEFATIKPFQIKIIKTKVIFEIFRVPDGLVCNNKFKAHQTLGLQKKIFFNDVRLLFNISFFFNH